MYCIILNVKHEYRKRKRPPLNMVYDPRPAINFISLHCIETFAMKFLTSLNYSPLQVEQVEQATKSQRLCERWHEERKFRITALKFVTVVKRERNLTSLVKQLLYSKVRYGGVSALLWGQQHKSDALDSCDCT